MSQRVHINAKGAARFLTGGLFFALLFTIALLSSCATAPTADEINPQQFVPQTFTWTKINDGIESFDYINKESHVIYHALRIDLQSPALAFKAYPQAADIDGEKTFKSKDTKKFGRENNLAVAINTTQFNERRGTRRQSVGILRLNGITLCDPVKRYAALAIDKNTAAVIAAQEEEECERHENVIGGFFVVLRDGECQPFKAFTLDARMGAGTDSEGRFLYILAVEKGFGSRGLSYQQCAIIFKEMGCTDALEFDGGSSTALYIDGMDIRCVFPQKEQGCSIGWEVIE